MKNKTLISIRVEPELLAFLDNAIERHPYWNRSSMMNHLLMALFKCERFGAVDGILSSYDPYDDKINIIASKN